MSKYMLFRTLAVVGSLMVLVSTTGAGVKWAW